MESLEELSLGCLAIARDAARLVMTGYRTRPRTEEKAKSDLVTEFDLRSQAVIFQALMGRFPGIPIMGEEGQPGSVEAAPTGLYFAVDPIDGTTNFAHGHPFFCVSIGLMDGARPVGGAIVAPALKTEWHGFHSVKGGGVWRDGEPAQVSARASLSEALVATGFPPDRSDDRTNNFASFTQVKKACRAVRRCGAAAIDLAFVADGTYDAYWERRLCVWDAAAGAAMVLGGGGTVTSLSGGPPDLLRGHVCASNGLVHASLLERVGET